MANERSATVIVLHAETLGRGDDALGAKLIGSYLRTLSAVDPKPEAIVFYNAAVRLLVPESAHLDALRALDEAGVELLACVTCLEHYALTAKIRGRARLEHAGDRAAHDRRGKGDHRVIAGPWPGG